MKTVTLLAVVTALAGTSGFLIKVPISPLQPVVAPLGWVHLQNLILPLFENVCEDSINPIIVRLAQEFIVDSSSGIYLKPEVVDNLWKLRDGKGFLPKGEIFTEYNVDHMNELKTVYELFYFAKNFDTFYKAAAWARQNVNCGVFVDAIYLAVLNRRDTEKLSVPAPYELLPNYFIPKDIIVKASSLLSGEIITPSETIQNEGNAYILDTNFTSADFNDSDESKLAYFHEDIGLNTYYFLQKLKKAPCINSSTDKNIRYGEYLYHMMKQLSARYNLERYANGFEDVESLDWASFTTFPYNPMLIYSNGNDFSQRTTDLSNINEAAFLRTIENNVATEVSRMVMLGYNKTEMLNYVMELLVTGDKSYETILRKALGKDTINNGQPSALEHYMTTLRDPVFWKINQKIVDIVDDALKTVPSYTRDDIYFPGVEVLNVDIKKVMTMFDYFQFDVTDALQSTDANSAFQVKIGQTRLNHKPFIVKLNISSLVTNKGYIKIFLGPKTMPGELAAKKNSFVLLDCFEYKFKIGTNVISRSSQEMINTSGDLVLLRTLRKKVEDAAFGLDSLPLKPIEMVTGFPSRLILPKGKPEGLPLQMFILVAPFAKTTKSGSLIIPNTELNASILSPGFPFDLSVEDSKLFNLPNAMLKDFVVTHKDIKKPGTDGSGGYNKEPYDYTSKKGQYGNKEQISAKPSYYKGNQYIESKKETVDTTTVVNDKLFEKDQINEPPKNQDITVDDKILPFDLSVEDSKLFNLPNAMLKDFVVTHKDIKKPGTDGSGGYNKEPYDYTSKKGQYGNKEQFSAKRSYYKGNQYIESKKETVDTTTVVNYKLFEKDQINQPSKNHDITVDDLSKADDVLENPYVYMIDPTNDLLYKPTFDVLDNQPDQKNYMSYLERISENKHVPTVYDYLFSKDVIYDNDDEVYE